MGNDAQSTCNLLPDATPRNSDGQVESDSRPALPETVHPKILQYPIFPWFALGLHWKLVGYAVKCIGDEVLNSAWYRLYRMKTYDGLQDSAQKDAQHEPWIYNARRFFSG